MTATPSTSDTEPSKETASPAHLPRMTGQAVSDLIGFTPTMLRKLEQQDFVERGEDKLFDPTAAVQGYIRWLKDDARRSSKTESAKRIEALREERLELELAAYKNSLGDLESYELTFVEMFTTLRNEVEAVPAGATRDLALRAKIEKLINGAFDRCRDKFENTLAALRSGGPVLDDAEAGEP